MNNLRQAVLGLWIARLADCGESKPAVESIADVQMSLADAQAFLADVQAKRGVPPAKHAEVTGMEELVAILSSDDVGRFEDAARFVKGKPGIDALTLEATIELAWSDAFSTVASLAAEFGKRAELEVERLSKKRDSGRGFTQAGAQMLDEVQKDASLLGKAKGALRVLAEDHLRAGGAPVSEALRQFEKDPRTYSVAAFYYLLCADWGQYGKAMRWFESEHAAPDAVQYLRATESLQRYGVRKDARAFLEEALKVNPKMVRAQAKLVLVQEEIDAKYAALQKLQAMAPSHVIVNIAGPSIRREYDISTSLVRARAAEKPSPAK